MRDRAPTRSHNKKAFLFVLFAIAVDGLGGGIIMPVFPQLLVELTGQNISQAAILGGWLISLFAIVQFFASPILGNLSDRYGRRPVLLGSLAAFGLNYLVLGLAPSIGWLFLGATLSGAFTATLAAANAFVADVTEPHDRAKKFGAVVAASGIGFIAGPLVVSLLSDYGTRTPFFVAAAIALLNVGYGLIAMPESLHKENRRSFSIWRANPLGAVIRLRTQPQVLRLLTALSLLQIAIQTIPIIWSYLLILRFGWSSREIGISLSIYALALVIVQGILLGRVNHRLGSLRTACLGFCCLIVGLIGYAFAAEAWIIIIFILPSAIGSMATAALVSYMSAHTRTDSQGELQGAVGAVAGATAALTPLLMTHLFNEFSAPNAAVYFPGAPYLTAALFAGMGLAFSIFALRRHNQAQREMATIPGKSLLSA